MNQEQLLEYQAIRAHNGLPPISDKAALVEAQALITFISLIVN